MSDSPLLPLLHQLQQLFRDEVTRAVQQALAQHAAATAPPTPAAEASTLLGVREAATFLQVSVATIHAWKRQGLLTYRKIGNRTLFEHAALLAAAQPQVPVFDGRRSTPRRRPGNDSAAGKSAA